MLEGQSSDLGDYDECINIKQGTNLQGKYCLINIQKKTKDRKESEKKSGEKIEEDSIASSIKLNLLERIIISGLESSHSTSFNYGICIPSNCHSEEIEHSLQKRLYIFLFTLSFLSSFSLG